MLNFDIDILFQASTKVNLYINTFMSSRYRCSFVEKMDRNELKMNIIQLSEIISKWQSHSKSPSNNRLTEYPYIFNLWWYVKTWFIMNSFWIEAYLLTFTFKKISNINKYK